MLSKFYCSFSDSIKNACHGSDSPMSAGREGEFFFPSNGPPRQSTAVFSECTCCVIKPHCLQNCKLFNQFNSFYTASYISSQICLNIGARIVSWVPYV